MRVTIYTATFAGLFYGVIAMGATSAEAARCAKGSVYRRSLGVCQSYAKAKASGARVYSRYAKASIKQRYKRPPVKRASNVQKAQIASPAQIPALRCDEICQLHINLASWVQRNRGTFQ